VQYLAKDPANTVVGIVRDKAAADKSVAADGLKNVTMVQAEIANYKSLLKARDEVAAITGGSLDYLINNAAFIDRSSMGKALDEFADETELLEGSLVESFKVNVVGVIHTINAFLPLVKKGSAKKVVLISSGMADPALINSGIATDAPYTISKAAANTAIYKYNAKYKKEGILFFALSPGVVATWGDGEEPEVIGDLRKGAPGWPGPLKPLESVEACLKVIHSFTAEENGGSFVSHHGNQQWL
jgi:NAD(P)-dependent dehydrogenase (short-subunit alcohol dehydrogenase family)